MRRGGDPFGGLRRGAPNPPYAGYPQQARRQNIAGSLVLDVAINPDGTLHSISVLRPSGHKLLDDAATRIVEMAAPYPPLPPDMRADVDILHITRTWKFHETGVTSSSD